MVDGRVGRAVALTVALYAAVCLADDLTVLRALQRDSRFSTLVSLLELTGMNNTLAVHGWNKTFFAPTNAAFAAQPAYLVAFLGDAANARQARGMLNAHVVMGPRVTPSTIVPSGKYYPTYLGCWIELRLASSPSGDSQVLLSGCVSFTSGRSGQGDFTETVNGNVFAVDGMLVPGGIVRPDALFFAEAAGPQRVGLTGFDGRNAGTIGFASAQAAVTGAVYDANNSLGFWTARSAAGACVLGVQNTSIAAAGAKPSFLPVGNVTLPGALAADALGNRLYVADSAAALVWSMRYDATDMRVFAKLADTQQRAVGVAADADTGTVLMLVRNGSAAAPTDFLVRQHRDGSEVAVVLAGLTQASALCIDARLRLAFVAHGDGGGSVSCVPYDSSAAPCPSPAGSGGAVLAGVGAVRACAVESTWLPYGGPQQLVVAVADKLVRYNAVTGALIGEAASGISQASALQLISWGRSGIM